VDEIAVKIIADTMADTIYFAYQFADHQLLSFKKNTFFWITRLRFKF